MPRINLIGASNRHTNQTCQYGSMAGLAPTTNVRPNVTGLPGYKVGVTAANQHNNDGSSIASNTTSLGMGCGLGKTCSDGTKCLGHLNFMNGTNTIGTFKSGRSKLLG
tara:strand:+ start:3868 stop:4191 length:324 start_codon:yes stop_codon:yes gene_type:complete